MINHNSRRYDYCIPSNYNKLIIHMMQRVAAPLVISNMNCLHILLLAIPIGLGIGIFFYYFQLN